MVSPGWLRGLFPPIPTAFDAGGAVAAPVLSFLQHLHRAGLDGVVALGSNGEATHLSELERIEWLTQIRKGLPAGLRLIAGTGVQSTRATVALSQSAAEAGAEAALVITPSYYRRDMTVEALSLHYRTVAQESPIPLIIYNVPANTGFDLPADWIARLAEHENIAGLKESSGDLGKISQVRRMVGQGFVILAGAGEQLLDALRAGADGAIAALSNVAPAETAAIRRATLAGDLDTARQLQDRIRPVGLALTRTYGVPGLKRALQLQGYGHGNPRSPLLPLDEGQSSALRYLLEKAGLLGAR
jgi:4-hydroxy-2-oxoglutarate aldolase